MVNQWDDPSQHDIPRDKEMEEMGKVVKTINLGPLYNPDGTPSEVTKAMFGHPHHQPNIFLSPFLKPFVINWLRDFLEENKDIDYESGIYGQGNSESFAFAVEEARQLFQRLS